MSFELGWRRIDQFVEPLPITEKDRDFSRVHKLAANEDAGNLVRAPTVSEGKKKYNMDAKLTEVKSWFCCYDTKLGSMFDHVVILHDDDTDDWSVSTSSTVSIASGTVSRDRSNRAGSFGSDVSDVPSNDASAGITPTPQATATVTGTITSQLSASNLASLAEQFAKQNI